MRQEMPQTSAQILRNAHENAPTIGLLLLRVDLRLRLVEADFRVGAAFLFDGAFFVGATRRSALKVGFFRPVPLMSPRSRCLLCRILFAPYLSLNRMWSGP